MQKFIISKDDSIFEAWPDIVLTSTGKLICVFTECNSHRDRDNSRIVMTQSDDRGRTWSKKIPLTSITNNEYCFNNARISRLSDNSLIILCDRVDRSTGFENGENTVVYMWKGNADGSIFSEPIITPAKGIVPDKLTELKCGRWLLAAHFEKPENKKLEQYLWYSDDRGNTWSDRITVAANDNYNLCEASIVELPDGVLVAFMRENSFMGYDCFKAVSKDRGETWEGVYNVPLTGCHRPVAGFLNDQSIMITYRYFQGGMRGLGNGSQNVFAAFTDLDSVYKNNRHEQKYRIMPLDYDRHKTPDTGYTGWVQFDDGEIYVVNYIMDDSLNSQILGYSFNISEVVL